MIEPPSQEVDKLMKSKRFYKKQYPSKVPHYYVHNIEEVRVDGLWLEFGVWVGTSINIIADCMRFLGKGDQIIHGFDSFEGLPEDWVDPETGERQDEGYKGCFDLQGEFPSKRFHNIKYVKGWFDESLPSFVEENTGPVAFLHIDSDLYSSAKTIFDCLEKQIVPGTVILFDEFYNYQGYQAHEYRAFKEFVEKNNVKYRWLSHVAGLGRQAALIIEEIK
jgi:transposase-like protein